MYKLLVNSVQTCQRIKTTFIFCAILFMVSVILDAYVTYYWPNEISLQLIALSLIWLVNAAFCWHVYVACLSGETGISRKPLGFFAIFTVVHLLTIALTFAILAMPYVYFLDENDRSMGILAAPLALACATGIFITVFPAYFLAKPKFRLTTLPGEMKTGLKTLLPNFPILILFAITATFSMIAKELRLFDVPLGAIKPVLGFANWAELVSIPVQFLLITSLAILGIGVYEEANEGKGSEV